MVDATSSGCLVVVEWAGCVSAQGAFSMRVVIDLASRVRVMCWSIKGDMAIVIGSSLKWGSVSSSLLGRWSRSRLFPTMHYIDHNRLFATIWPIRGGCRGLASSWESDRDCQVASDRIHC